MATGKCSMSDDEVDLLAAIDAVRGVEPVGEDRRGRERQGVLGVGKVRRSLDGQRRQAVREGRQVLLYSVGVGKYS
jgi:hypothetical protein